MDMESAELPSFYYPHLTDMYMVFNHNLFVIVCNSLCFPNFHFSYGTLYISIHIFYQF